MMRYLLLSFLLLLGACQRPDATPAAPALDQILPARAIPALDAPATLGADEALRTFGPLTTVLTLSLDGEARAYPIGMLSRREIVNDTLAGRPIGVTFCPLCNSAVVFDRTVEGQALTFDHSGALLDGAMVMVDRESGSLWPQSRLAALDGPKKGQRLTLLAANQMSLGTWVADHPDGTVATDGVQPLFTGALLPTLGSEPPAVAGYVLGLATPQGARAYPLEAIAAAGLINDEAPDGTPLLLVALGEPGAVAAWNRTVEGQTLTFRRDGSALVDEQTGSRWDARSGQATEGALAGAALPRADLLLAHWLGWVDLYPQSEVWGGG